MDKDTRDTFKVAAGNVPKEEVRSLTGTILLAGHDHRALTPNECHAIATLMMMGRDVAFELDRLTELLDAQQVAKTQVFEPPPPPPEAPQETEGTRAGQPGETAPPPDTNPVTGRPKPPAAQAPKPRSRK
jgi:hypothetical protein